MTSSRSDAAYAIWQRVNGRGPKQEDTSVKLDGLREAYDRMDKIVMPYRAKKHMCELIESLGATVNSQIRDKLERNRNTPNSFDLLVQQQLGGKKDNKRNKKKNIKGRNDHGNMYTPYFAVKLLYLVKSPFKRFKKRSFLLRYRKYMLKELRKKVNEFKPKEDEMDDEGSTKLTPGDDFTDYDVSTVESLEMLEMQENEEDRIKSNYGEDWDRHLLIDKDHDDDEEEEEEEEGGGGGRGRREVRRNFRSFIHEGGDNESLLRVAVEMGAAAGASAGRDNADVDDDETTATHTKTRDGTDDSQAGDFRIIPRRRGRLKREDETIVSFVEEIPVAEPLTTEVNEAEKSPPKRNWADRKKKDVPKELIDEVIPPDPENTSEFQPHADEIGSITTAGSLIPPPIERIPLTPRHPEKIAEVFAIRKMERALFRAIPVGKASFLDFEKKLTTSKAAHSKLDLIMDTINKANFISQCKSINHFNPAGCPICGVIHLGPKSAPVQYITSVSRESGVRSLIPLASEKEILAGERLVQEAIVKEADDALHSVEFDIHHRATSGIQAHYASRLAWRQCMRDESKLQKSLFYYRVRKLVRMKKAIDSNQLLLTGDDPKGRKALEYTYSDLVNEMSEYISNRFLESLSKTDKIAHKFVRNLKLAVARNRQFKIRENELIRLRALEHKLAVAKEQRRREVQEMRLLVGKVEMERRRWFCTRVGCNQRRFFSRKRYLAHMNIHLLKEKEEAERLEIALSKKARRMIKEKEFLDRIAVSRSLMQIKYQSQRDEYSRTFKVDPESVDPDIVFTSALECTTVPHIQLFHRSFNAYTYFLELVSLVGDVQVLCDRIPLDRPVVRIGTREDACGQGTVSFIDDTEIMSRIFQRKIAEVHCLLYVPMGTGKRISNNALPPSNPGLFSKESKGVTLPAIANSPFAARTKQDTPELKLLTYDGSGLDKSNAVGSTASNAFSPRSNQATGVLNLGSKEKNVEHPEAEAEVETETEEDKYGIIEKHRDANETGISLVDNSTMYGTYVVDEKGAKKVSNCVTSGYKLKVGNLICVGVRKCGANVLTPTEASNACLVYRVCKAEE